MTFYSEHTARFDYVCGWECGHPIVKGSRYVRAALPPHAEPNESDHWWVQRTHGRCWEGCPGRDQVRGTARSARGERK